MAKGTITKKRLVSAFALAVAAGMALSGCAGAQSEPVPEGKMAASFEAYIDQFLEMPELSDYQREILSDAKERGELLLSDYERAWSDYKSCMVQRGYKNIIVMTYPNGMHDEAAHAKGTDAQEQHYSDAMFECQSTYTSYVDSIFGVQQGNPKLYSNTSEGLVDCLKRNNLVPAGYTLEQYLKEDKGYDGTGSSYSFDKDDPEVKGCQVANGFHYTDTASDPIEKLW